MSLSIRIACSVDTDSVDTDSVDTDSVDTDTVDTCPSSLMM
jgi:hypothetical protein